MPVQTSTSSFQVQFQQVMYYLGPIVQVLFWIAVGFAALYAAIQFKRLVDAYIDAQYLDAEEFAEAIDADESAQAESAPSVDQFVE